MNMKKGIFCCGKNVNTLKFVVFDCDFCNFREKAVQALKTGFVFVVINVVHLKILKS